MRYVILVLVLAAIGAGSLWLGERGASAIERLLAGRVGHGLAVLEIDWAEISADGLRLELRGDAPDPAALALALETARSIAPFATVVDSATVAQAPPSARAPIMLELMRDGRSVVMTGRFHGERMRAALVNRLSAGSPELTLNDLTGINAARPGSGWGPELALAALAVTRIEDTYVRVEPGAVSIEAVVPDAEHREALTDELLALAGDAVRLTLGLREPPRVAAPFLFAAAKDAAGAVRAEACHARDAEEAARLEAALGRHGVLPGERRCMVALGGPDGDWPGAVEAGLDALDALPAGSFRLEYRAVQLEAADGAADEADDGVASATLERARQALSAALPDGYALTAPEPGTPASDAGASDSGAVEYRMRLSRSADGSSVRGLVTSETARGLVGTYALARLGPAELQLAAAPPGTGTPAGWEPAALTALDALGRVAAGEAELAPGHIRLTGRVAEPAEAGRIHREMEQAAPAGYAVETVLTVDLPAAVAAVPVSAGRCTVLLNAEVGRQPISFSPGDAVFEAGSDAALDRVAAVLGRCEPARIEVGGHTDSRGPEEMNRSLSQRRADAVLDALVERGVPLATLTARGYGEDEPIATNATEEGRARNRRISFKVAECDTGPAGC